MAVTMKNAIFWDMAPCRSGVNRCFGGMYRLHLQGRKIRERGTSVSRWLQTRTAWMCPHRSVKELGYLSAISSLMYPVICSEVIFGSLFQWVYVWSFIWEVSLFDADVFSTIMAKHLGYALCSEVMNVVTKNSWDWSLIHWNFLCFSQLYRQSMINTCSSSG
jgi:hypothetical protein